jgi:two-component system, chemotaxis family, CheB/CheR fusion protein
MLLYKAMREHFINLKVQIFATDIDERSLNYARRGLYNEDSIRGIKQEDLQSFFLLKSNDYEVFKHIRTMVIFSKHDLTNSPPFMNLHMISCRNFLKSMEVTHWGLPYVSGW